MKRLFTAAFCPSFRRLFRSSCSSMTFLVSDAVAEFLSPLSEAFSPSALGFAFLSSSDEDLDLVAVPLVSLSAVFLRFLLPGAFLSACVRPFLRSVLTRRLRRARSVGIVGRMGMTSFSAYGSLHCANQQISSLLTALRMDVPADMHSLQPPSPRSPRTHGRTVRCTPPSRQAPVRAP